MFSLALLSIIFNLKSIMYICSHMLCVPILPVYLLLSVSVYSCILFILDMKQTDVGEGCNFEVITFDCILFILDMKQTDVGEGCNFEVITFDYIFYI